MRDELLPCSTCYACVLRPAASFFVWNPSVSQTLQTEITSIVECEGEYSHWYWDNPSSFAQSRLRPLHGSLISTTQPALKSHIPPYVRPAESPKWMSTSLLVRSHTAQRAWYPILNPSASPNNGEIAHHEHLANYSSHNAVHHVPQQFVILNTRLSTLQSVYQPRPE